MATYFFPTPPPMLSTMPSGKAGEGLQEYSPSLALVHTLSYSNVLLPPQLYASCHEGILSKNEKKDGRLKILSKLDQKQSKL